MPARAGTCHHRRAAKWRAEAALTAPLPSGHRFTARIFNILMIEFTSGFFSPFPACARDGSVVSLL